MKKYVTLLALFCLCLGYSAEAQTPKFGHINVQELINLMPDRDSAYARIQRYVASLEEMYVSIQNEYQMKINEFQQKQATWTAAILEIKQREIYDFQTRLEQFQQNAQQDIADQQSIHFTPVQKKADEAIKKVGKELGLIYVFDSAGMPYIDESQSMPLLDKVKAELKIPAEKVAPTLLGN